MDPLYRSVLVFSHSEYREFFPSLAKALKKAQQSRIVFYCATEQEKHYYLSRHGDWIDTIHSVRFYYESLLEPLDNTTAILKKAEEYEKKYNFLFTHLLADDRHMGLGFSTGGINFPRSIFSRNASYVKSLRALTRLMEHLESVLAKEGITLVINPVKALSVIANGRGIPQRIFTATRYRNYYYWAINDVLESNLIGPAFEQRKHSKQDIQLESQPQYYLDARRQALKSFKLGRMVYNIGYEILRRGYQRVRGYEKARGYLLKGNIRAHYRTWSEFRKLRKYTRWKLEDIKGRRFIYFPLGVEPERSLTRDSPEFCHQHYAAHAIAKDLPAGIYLAVKEHLTAIGPRPDDFYKSLSMMNNVIMIDPMESSLEIIKASRAVATVTGTAGLEAAFMGVPVLSFGKHNIYNIVPHVHTITSWLDIPSTVSAVLNHSESEREKREQDGSRFLKAMMDVSVDCDRVDFNRPIAAEIIEKVIHLMDATFRD